MQIVINRRTKDVDKVAIVLKDVEFTINENDDETICVTVRRYIGTDVDKLDLAHPIMAIIPMDSREVMITRSMPEPIEEDKGK